MTEASDDPKLYELGKQLERVEKEIARQEHDAQQARYPAGTPELLAANRHQRARLEAQIASRKAEIAREGGKRRDEETVHRGREVVAAERSADAAVESAREARAARMVAAVSLILTVLVGLPSAYYSKRATLAAEDQAGVARQGAEAAQLQNRAVEEAELNSAREVLMKPNLGLLPWAELNAFAHAHEPALRRIADPSNAFMASEAAVLGGLMEREAPSSTNGAALCDQKMQAAARIGRLAGAERFSPESMRAVLSRPLGAFLQDEYPRCLVALEPYPGNRAAFVGGYYWGGDATSSAGSSAEALLTFAAPDGFVGLCSRLGLDVPRQRAVPPSPKAEDLLKAVLSFSGCGGYIKNVQVLGNAAQPGKGGVSLVFTPQWVGSPGADLTCFEWKPANGSGWLGLGLARNGDTVLSVDLPGVGAMEARVPARRGRYAPRQGVALAANWDLGSLSVARTLQLVVDGDEANARIPVRALFVKPGPGRGERP